MGMPDCRKDKNKEKAQCLCKNPAKSDMDICQHLWNKPSIAKAVGRIVGGELAPRDAYPWFARLVTRGGSWWGCGGMLVAERYVLTAAHCVTSNDANRLAVQIGAVCPTTSNNNCGQPIQTINAQSIVRHPQYSSSSVDNDFALIRLASSANADPVPMDQGTVVDNYNSSKRGLYAIGFGSLSSGGSVSSELRHVELAYVPRNTCNSDYNGGITDSMMCAKDPGQDSCQGDSGGPLYGEANNALVGVVSWGYGCADPNYPGVYAQVSAEFDWIKTNICSTSPSETFCGNSPPSAPTPTAPTPTAPTPTSPTPAVPTIALKPCKNNKVRWALQLTTDQYGSETSFNIWTRKGNGQFKRGYGRSDFPSETTVTYSKCVKSNKCYKVVVEDSYGDGMCCGYGEGSFQGYYDGSAVQNVDAVFENGISSESETFGNC